MTVLVTVTGQRTVELVQQLAATFGPSSSTSLPTSFAYAVLDGPAEPEQLDGEHDR